MNRNNDVHAYMFEQSIHTGVVIGCFDAFCQTITQKTVVVMDNASIHRSEAFEDRIPSWKKQGLIIKYLPPYSPDSLPDTFFVLNGDMELNRNWKSLI
jgi:hypothetical protein